MTSSNVQTAVARNLATLRAAVEAARAEAEARVARWDCDDADKHEYLADCEAGWSHYLARAEHDAVRMYHASVMHPFTVRNERHSMTRLPQAVLTVLNGTVKIVRDFSPYVTEGREEVESVFVNDHLVATVTETWEPGNSCVDETEVSIQKWVEGDRGGEWVLLPGWEQIRPGVYFHAATRAVFETDEEV